MLKMQCLLDKRSEYQEQLENDMYSKPVMKQVQQDLGVNTFATSEEDVPNNDEELGIIYAIEV